MDHAAAVWESLSELRRTAPLVHNITNMVAMDISANLLLALGASPAMIMAPEEVEDFALLADALVANIGTLSKSSLTAMRRAADRAAHASTPVRPMPFQRHSSSMRGGASRT